MISERKLTVIDVGCGAGWKLVHYLSKEFRTIGMETEPAISFLRKTYPELVRKEQKERERKGKNEKCRETQLQCKTYTGIR
jgi:hypothetical protein